jgi:hypothetical protein
MLLFDTELNLLIDVTEASASEMLVKFIGHTIMFRTDKHIIEKRISNGRLIPMTPEEMLKYKLTGKDGSFIAINDVMTYASNSPENEIESRKLTPTEILQFKLTGKL